MQVLMIDLHNNVKKMIEVERPYIGENIRSQGRLFKVEDIILRSGGNIIEVIVNSPMDLSHTVLINKMGWKKL